MKMLADCDPDHLLSQGEISWLEIIETAKVPVVKVRSQSCGLRADVVFSQPDGMESSKFIRSQLKEYPQMKPLLLFLKYFLLQRGLHETYTGGMGSYLLCNVVLHFLQRHPSFRSTRQYAGTSLGHLLFDFLKYYGQEFNYMTQGISVLDGGSTFAKASRFPEKKQRGPVQLCLESPLAPDMDLGGACFRMHILRNLFHHGFHCVCHLFVSRSPPEVSMLCPLLIDPAHPVITDRFKLMSEQPAALPGLKRKASQAESLESSAAPKKAMKRASSESLGAQAECPEDSVAAPKKAAKRATGDASKGRADTPKRRQRAVILQDSPTKAPDSNRWHADVAEWDQSD
ncbi:Tent4a [Symbiodinium natans]|uniref:Tent4a protein n=1 Tax=Symbiodinium natans TaxID=878477 RepID=A0A812QHX1_9DINO|nr:Tent4a [Symbiodinium natans]